MGSPEVMAVDDAETETPATKLSAAAPELNYSSFSIRQKNAIIGLAAFAGWFSSISSFIYFPAIPFLAVDLHVDIQQVNLTVTSYLIMSGVFPSIMGDAADRFGRRPVFLVAMIVYFFANVGLALQSQFALLFVVRMFQSASISGTFSLAYGVLSDLFTPAERGWYSGVLAFFLNTPPSIGPALSGLLLLRWTWRSIFWFLATSSTICILSMVLFLPETARSIIGNGSISPKKGVTKPFIPLLLPKHARTEQEAVGDCDPPPPIHVVRSHTRKFPNPFASLKLLRFPDTTILLLAYGINYTVYCCLQASLSTLFVEIYRVSGVIAGLIYLPFGVACAISAFATGKLLDIDYNKTAAECGVPVEKGRTSSSDLRDFPIEKARLRTVVYTVVLSAALVVAYGWVLEGGIHTSIAAPLALQFAIGLTIQPVFTALNTLLVDIHPDSPSTAQAACNFVRCEMAAACLAGLDALLRRVGPGWSFSLFGSTLFLVVVLLVVLRLRGMAWRQVRSRTA